MPFNLSPFGPNFFFFLRKALVSFLYDLVVLGVHMCLGYATFFIHLDGAQSGPFSLETCLVVKGNVFFLILPYFIFELLVAFRKNFFFDVLGGFLVLSLLFLPLSFLSSHFSLKSFSLSVSSFPAIPPYFELISFLVCVLDLYLSR